MSSMTYVGMQQLKMDVDDNDYELCVSCAHKLRAWLSGEENDYAKECSLQKMQQSCK